jgi:hypothetical protein
MACWNRNVLHLMDQWAAHNDSGTIMKHLCLLYLLPNTTVACNHWAGASYCMKRAYWNHVVLFFNVKSRQEWSWFKAKEIEHLACHRRCFHGMETIMHSIIKTALQSVALAPQFQSTLTVMKTMNRWNCKATLIPQSYWQVSQCWQICPHCLWSAEKFGQCWLCSRHMISKEEEKTEETCFLPSPLAEMHHWCCWCWIWY